MACPACGGSRVKVLEPGYVQCTSDVIKIMQGAGPQGVPVAGPCGRRYHDGPSAQPGDPACSCGTYAVGTCQSCGRSSCGYHSNIRNNKRVCSDCVQAEGRQLLEAQKAQRQAALREVAERPLATHRDRVAYLQGDSRRRRVRDSPVTGADIAAALKDAGRKPEIYKLAKGIRLQRTVRFKGWGFGTDPIEPDAPAYKTYARYFLDPKGVRWKYYDNELTVHRDARTRIDGGFEYYCHNSDVTLHAGRFVA